MESRHSIKGRRTFTDCSVVLRVPGVTDTLEGADRVTAVGVFVTRVDLTLVDVLATVPAREAVRTLGTARRLVTRSVTVTTVAVTKTILTPRTARTRCTDVVVRYKAFVESYIIDTCEHVA